MPSDYKQILRGVTADEYGENHAQHVLHIYHGYVQSAERISSRRQRANSFFLTVNTGLVGFIGYLKLVDRPVSAEMSVLILVALTGAASSYLWYRMVRSYRDLNSAKFKIVHEIEQSLPLRPYEAEWELVGRGNDPDRYLPFTRIEAGVPWIFIAAYGAVILLSIL